MKRFAPVLESARQIKVWGEPCALCGWKLVPVEPTPEMLSAVGMMDGYDWHAPGCSPDADHANWYSAMIAAAPAAPQAEPQPVAAVPVDWMERLKEAVKHIGYANVEKWYRLGGEDMIEQAKSDAVTAYATLCEALESLYAAPAAPQAEPKRDQSMLDLLAVIHCDGGHHTEAVGIEQSIKDALDAVYVLKGKLAEAEPKREPLRDSELVTMYAECPRCDAEMIAFARAVERAHGIGGSDAE